MGKEEDLMYGYLKQYDNSSKIDLIERRTAAKSLYNYFQILLLEVGARFCNRGRNRLYSLHLSTRWTEIKTVLCLDDTETNRWDDILGLMGRIRGKVEHKDYYDPSLEDLKKIREKSTEFADWLINKAKNYYRESSGFSLLQSFKLQLSEYNDNAKWKLEEYGEKPYIASEYEYLDQFKDVAYENLPDIMERTEERLRELTNSQDITTNDIKLLTGLVEFIAEFECREHSAISNGICPKCGGKITSTTQYIGGGYDEPPSEAYYRVGCENCDYILHDETFNL